MISLDTVFWILVAAILSAMPISFIKHYTQTKDIYWLILSLFCYIILIYALTNLLDKTNIAIIYPIIKSLSIILVVLFGIIYFEHKLNQYTGLGILFGLASIALLAVKSD